MALLTTFIYWFFKLLVWAIIIRVLLSWFGNPRNAFTLLIARIADPVLAFFRRFIPLIGMIDISPIVAILVIDYSWWVLCRNRTRPQLLPLNRQESAEGYQWMLAWQAKSQDMR